MPINSSLFISGSVGAGGRNKRDDVAAVQQRLNDFMNAAAPAARRGRAFGPQDRTGDPGFPEDAVMGFRRGDGRVDPDGKTIRGLSDPGSEGKWAKMSIPPQEELRPRRGPGAGLSEPELDKHEELHTAIANETGDQAMPRSFSTPRSGLRHRDQGDDRHARRGRKNPQGRAGDQGAQGCRADRAAGGEGSRRPAADAIRTDVGRVSRGDGQARSIARAQAEGPWAAGRRSCRSS